MIGQRLGPYEITAKLGEGGMGSVWLAKTEVTGRDFAIKFLHEGTGAKEGQLARFFGDRTFFTVSVI